MSLFNDGNLTTSEDLRAVESAILDVASTEGIELDKKLQVATREIGARITEFLLDNGDNPARARDLQNVVVTEPLRDWHIAHTLAVIFRDAYSSQLNDRYAAKCAEYERRAREAARRLFAIGVGLSSDPVPGAELPQCGTANGGVLPARNYAVQVCWQSASGRTGGLSEPVVVHVAAGQLMTVKAMKAPEVAAGWNVYVGYQGGDVVKQNASAIVPGATWIMPVDGLSDSSTGQHQEQVPDSYVMRNRIFRG